MPNPRQFSADIATQEPCKGADRQHGMTVFLCTIELQQNPKVNVQQGLNFRRKRMRFDRNNAAWHFGFRVHIMNLPMESLNMGNP